MIEYFRMRIGVIWIASPVDIVLVDVTAVQSESKVSIIHHVAPGGVERVLSPKFNIIEFPVDTHPIPILDIGFKHEVVDVILQIKARAQNLYEVGGGCACVGNDLVRFYEVNCITYERAFSI